MKRRTKQALEELRRYESRNITFMAPDGSWPIVWERARNVHVWDCDGKKYLDLTAAFGVAAAGHRNPAVVLAGQKQLARLPHAMGDVHPHRLKGQLAAELSRLTFERWLAAPSGTRWSARQEAAHGKSIFCSSGFEAVEAALKTAMLWSGKPGVIAFEGAYHGLGYGALNTTHREHFRGRFRSQLREFASFLPFPSEHTAPDQYLADLERRVAVLCRKGKIGAILLEPVQARGGVRIPPPGFLPALRALCDQHHLALILDEIYTGFGRTGRWFACEHWNVVPDIICLGKALGGGFPISACVGRAGIMDSAWPAAQGEAIHTSTFLGNPVGCAMALANIGEIERHGLIEASNLKGQLLKGMLTRVAATVSSMKTRRGQPFQASARGLGLMAGLELRNVDGSPATDRALQCVTRLLHQGFIVLPEGESSNVISFTPPLTITRSHLVASMAALEKTFAEAFAS